MFMSYGTFALDTSPVRREARFTHNLLVLLTELIASTLASFVILISLLYLAHIEFVPLFALEVTFGFTCLVFGALEGVGALWYTYRGWGEGAITLDDARAMEELEDGLVEAYVYEK
ncbi:hypothetical protein C8R46DRAFT_1188724 [Mycena filopes]|nr:hypothetical protein C8R46DRAFT_1188724 [Mycena filopes]